MLRTPGRFHHPLGDPALPPEEERRWRLGLTRAALVTLQQVVTGPTVFEPSDLGSGEETGS
jgi:hypothetical protein